MLLLKKINVYIYFYLFITIFNLLGSFCAQYGIEMPIPPSQILKKQKLYRETPFKNKKFTNKREKPYKKLKKFKSQKSNDQKSTKKEVRCFKCG